MDCTSFSCMHSHIRTVMALAAMRGAQQKGADYECTFGAQYLAHGWRNEGSNHRSFNQKISSPTPHHWQVKYDSIDKDNEDSHEEEDHNCWHKNVT